MGRPAVTPADVPNQLLDRPPRTGRHRRRRVSTADQFTEQLVLFEQGCDVIHNEIIPFAIDLLKVGGGRASACRRAGNLYGVSAVALSMTALATGFTPKSQEHVLSDSPFNGVKR